MKSEKETDLKDVVKEEETEGIAMELLHEFKESNKQWMYTTKD